MNFQELEKKLAAIGVNDCTYSLGKNFNDEQYCLEKINKKWHYYYSERGLRTGGKIFKSESEACKYLFSILEKDPSVKF